MLPFFLPEYQWVSFEISLGLADPSTASSTSRRVVLVVYWVVAATADVLVAVVSAAVPGEPVVESAAALGEPAVELVAAMAVSGALVASHTVFAGCDRHVVMPTHR